MTIQLDSQKIQVLLKLKPVRLFLVFFVTVSILPIVAQVLFNALYGDELFAGVNPNISALCMLLGYSVAYFITFLYAKDYFKITLQNLFKQVSFGHLVFSVFVGLIFTAVIIQVMAYIPPPMEFSSTTDDFQNGTAFSRSILILFTCLLGPFFEEFVFRGYIYDAFRQKYSMGITALASSLMFTIPHMHNYYVYWPAALVIFSLGMLLAYFRKRNDSLLPCLLLHMSYNTGLLLLFFAAEYL